MAPGFFFIFCGFYGFFGAPFKVAKRVFVYFVYFFGAPCKEAKSILEFFGMPGYLPGMGFIFLRWGFIFLRTCGP